VLNISDSEVKTGLEALRDELMAGGRGLMLLSSEDAVQLVTKPDFAGFLEEIVKSEISEALTPAALETLSIVSYTAPTTRAEIDYIRGVNSSFILRSLSIRGLVDRTTDPNRGNAYTYTPSFELLKYLGTARTEDLPEYDNFRKLVQKFNEEVTPKDEKKEDEPTATTKANYE
jgi:segregation and condensation protein B